MAIHASGNEEWVNGEIITAEKMEYIEEIVDRQASKLHNTYLTCSDEWLKRDLTTNKVILNEKCITQNLFNIFSDASRGVLTMIDITNFIESNQLNILRFKNTSDYNETIDLTQENIIRLLSYGKAKTGENNTEDPDYLSISFFVTDERGVEYEYNCRNSGYDYYFIKKENRYYIAMTGYISSFGSSPSFSDIKQPYNIRFDTANGFNVITKPIDIELSYFTRKDLLSIE